MLGQDLGVVVDVVEAVGDPEVDAGPPQGGDVVDDDLAHQGVGEAVDAGLVGHGHEQPVDEGGLEVVEDVVEVPARRPGEEAEVDVAADDRRHPQQVTGGVGEQGEPPADDVAHAAGHVGGRQAVAAGQQAGQLGREEGVALGAGVDGGGGDGVEGVAGGLGDEGRRGCAGEAPEAEPPGPRRPGEEGEGVHDGVVAADLELPDGGHDQQRHVDQPAEHRGEQLERVDVGPLQVVDHQHDRPDGGAGGQQRRHRLGQGEPGRLRRLHLVGGLGRR